MQLHILYMHIWLWLSVECEWLLWIKKKKQKHTTPIWGSYTCWIDKTYLVDVSCMESCGVHSLFTRLRHGWISGGRATLDAKRLWWLRCGKRENVVGYFIQSNNIHIGLVGCHSYKNPKQKIYIFRFEFKTKSFLLRSRFDTHTLNIYACILFRVNCIRKRTPQQSADGEKFLDLLDEHFHSRIQMNLTECRATLTRSYEYLLKERDTILSRLLEQTKNVLLFVF